MSCHVCDITALGCSGCDTHHTFPTHNYLHCGLGSPVLSSQVFFREFTRHLTAGLFANDNPSKSNVEISLAKGTLGRYSRCRLSAAIQVVASELSQTLASEILQKVEKTLEEDEAARNKAREAAEEEARKRAKAIAEETAKATAEEVAKRVAEKLAPVVAKSTATEIATKLAPSVAESTAKEIATRLAPEAAKQPAIDTATKVANEVASQLAPEAARQPAVDTATKIATKIANETTSAVEGAIEAAQDMRDFEMKNMRGFESLRGETQQVIRDASKRAPAVVQKFSIPKDLTPKVPRLALYDFLVLCGTTQFSFRLDPINKFSKLTRKKIIVAR
jgi:hypothetical protein